MAVRLTTWNVNGIRNPFSYQPWREKKSFDAMFDTLEADIVVFQETKIQRKDLRDDMVLVPGWDCYFSLPKQKKGYAGVVVYTRNSKCSPIRAEEGITGVLSLPFSSTRFRDMPPDEQIGGYPSQAQLQTFDVDSATLDAEGRCVILEFPAFVLLGVYSPAHRDESRDEFRLAFLNALDARIRNLIALGKRVVLTGDLNIAGAVIDSAHAAEAIRKGNTTKQEYISSPSRRLFNQLVQYGEVSGDREHGREEPVLRDLCRSFHADRTGMYTCWEQRVNARPGNYGSRIDYVLCSLDMVDWFNASNIQEGLMGSDHCPVYAVLNEKVLCDGTEINILDIMNPPGTFENGKRKREYSLKYLLPLSGRLIPEFDGRRSIKDMFRTSSMPSSKTRTDSSLRDEQRGNDPKVSTSPSPRKQDSGSPTAGLSNKRSKTNGTQTMPPPKRAKQRSDSAPSKGQQTLAGFVQASRPKTNREDSNISDSVEESPDSNQSTLSQNQPEIGEPSLSLHSSASNSGTPIDTGNTPKDEAASPVTGKESWSKLFTKKPAPRCEEHDEACISLVTKKPGLNCGRSFWICSRPLGPSGNKESGTPWRCSTFIWCSDWKAPGD